MLWLINMNVDVPFLFPLTRGGKSMGTVALLNLFHVVLKDIRFDLKDKYILCFKHEGMPL